MVQTNRGKEYFHYVTDASSVSVAAGVLNITYVVQSLREGFDLHLAQPGSGSDRVVAKPLPTIVGEPRSLHERPTSTEVWIN